MLFPLRLEVDDIGAGVVMRQKRSRYVVDRAFQYRLVGTFLLMIVLALMLFSALVAGYYWVRYRAGENLFREFITVHRQVETVNDQGQILTTTQSEAPVNRVEMVLPPLLVNNLIIAVLTAVIGIFYSHRISGAAHRIQSDVDRALQGERDVQIRLRKRDQLQRLAAQINLVLEELDRYR